MYLRRLAIAAMIALGASPGLGATLALFDGQLAPSVLDSNVNANMFSYFIGQVPGGGADLRYYIFPNPSTISQAVADGNYIQLSIGPKAGFRVELTRLSFDLSISAVNSAPAVAQVFATWDLNGFDVSSPLTAGSAVDAGIDNLVGLTTSISATLSATTDSQIIFRLYHAATEQTLFFDNLRVEGNVVAVPEPAGFCGTFMVGCVLLIRGRHCRSRYRRGRS